MPDSRNNDNAVVRAILDILATGLPQDEAVVHFIHSTLGGLSPRELDAVLADRDDPQAASLAELLLFPGQAVAMALEQALAAARLDADGARELALSLAAAAPGQAVAVLPDGTRIAVPLEPDDVPRFVARLAPARTLPEDCASLLAERYGSDALGLAVAARQTGPDWTPGTAAFFRTLLSRLDPAAPNATDTLRFALRFLAGLPKTAQALPALNARRVQLSLQLRRARQQEDALAKSNYETLMMTGARLPYLHAPDIDRELGHVDAILLALTGRLPADTPAGCQDLGLMADMDDMFAAFDEK